MKGHGTGLRHGKYNGLPHTLCHPDYGTYVKKYISVTTGPIPGLPQLISAVIEMWKQRCVHSALNTADVFISAAYPVRALSKNKTWLLLLE